MTMELQIIVGITNNSYSFLSVKNKTENESNIKNLVNR